MKNESRSKKALKNTGGELLRELILAICGLILPRLILSHFGSSYNGITQSITQFIGCVALLKSGIGSVTRAALYKPLAERDYESISGIVNATEKFMRRIAIIFSVAVLMFASVYPLLVKEDFSWFFAFSLVIILSIDTFAQYFFGLTNQMVLQADQRNYIISFISILSTIVNTVVASGLILLGLGIRMVKLGSAIVFLFAPIFYLFYVRKHYKIDKSVPPRYDLISQRWNAFGHQVANFINTNTDIIVTTVFLGVKEVSVYGVFNMVANNLRKIITSVTSGTSAAFGNMLAKGEEDNLKKRFGQFETLLFTISTIIFTTTALLYIPFIRIYTRGVTDVNYIRPILAILFCLVGFCEGTKLPYDTLVFAVGDFKQTQKNAYAEAAINIIVSVVLVNFIGLNGILIGTIAGGLYRTIRYNYYVSKNVIHRSALEILKKYMYTILTVLVCLGACYFLPFGKVNDYFSWFIAAVIVFTINTIIGLALSYLLFKDDTINMLKTIKKTITKR